VSATSGRCTVWRIAGRDAGMVTAELAVGLPALLAVVGLCLTAVAAVALQLRCLDAASGAARLAARGQSAGIPAFTRADAPPGARIVTRYAAGRVTVTVDAELQVPVLGAVLPVTVSGAATDSLEPGVNGAAPR
jgi:hypothetical protein